MAGFIRYQVKNNVEYASHCVAKRVDGKKINDVINLGRVIDKERGIYENRKNGRFAYTIENGIVELPAEVETGIYDFGNAFSLHKVLENRGFLDLLKRVFGSEYDTLLALVFYRVLQGGANCNAADWFDGSWAKSLFPTARLQSQRLSDFLEVMGDEQLAQRFFEGYIRFAECSNAILIDSTGLPNAIDIPLTAVNNHNGQINSEIRFILVHDRETNLPLYFRYAAGNIVDVSTLSTTISELSQFGVKIDYALLDSGYCSENNVQELFSDKIRFITRLGVNRNLCKSLFREHLQTLQNVSCAVKYRDRLLHIKRVEVDLYGNKGFAYVAIDDERRYLECKHYMLEELAAGEKSTDEMETETQNMGAFVMISSESLANADVIRMYYKRQAIEQMFDISKNCAELLPLRVHSETKFRGHLLVSFISIVAYQLADKMLANQSISLVSAMNILRNLKVKVFPEKAIVQEPTRRVKEIAKLFSVDIPAALPCGEKKRGN